MQEQRRENNMDSLNKINLDNYKPLRDVVFETLRKAIIDGDLKPGQRLMEVQLAEKLGVSRTPVREAIRKLELEGIVTMVPRKGAYVSEMSLQDIVEVLEVRASLEGLAARMAAKYMSEEDLDRMRNKANAFEKAAQAMERDELIRYDKEMHEIIFESANNHILMNLVDGLSEKVQQFRVTYLTATQNAEDIIKEHRELIAAIVSRDEERARCAAEAHIQQIKNFIKDHIKMLENQQNAGE